MKICYLPIFLAVASFSMPGVKARNLGAVRIMNSQVSAVISTVMLLIIPSEAMTLFTGNTHETLSRNSMELPSSGPIAPLGRTRRSSIAWESQLKRIQNEVETLERMVESSPVNRHMEKVSRVERGTDESNDEDSADVGGKAMEVAGKGAAMAGNGMQMAEQGAKMASDGAQGAKAGADALGNGAEMVGKGAEVFGAAAQQGQDVATSFSG
ncbi:uncharacterized protein LOC129004270 [Macrosteles quadrilineatus]|uniref:uncharacterized protein LOC129004270 n=1 Tax=Macrosteles quadrilineatus TaxID=74068 RepID=UPI0023E1D40C|nr:uncharacterized protein LOC129004270 [Macrosteles quadrilineatus]